MSRIPVVGCGTAFLLFLVLLPPTIAVVPWDKPPMSSRDSSPFVLDSLGPCRFVLRLSDRRGAGSRWMIAHPVFRFEMGDLDGDGKPEACLGVVKSTRFDPCPRRRLFVFRRVGGTIRPAWLGSRLGSTLEDFRLLPQSDGSLLLSLERSSAPRGGYAVLRWRWSSFGPRFLRRDHAGRTRVQALHVLHSIQAPM